MTTLWKTVNHGLSTTLISESEVVSDQSDEEHHGCLIYTRIANDMLKLPIKNR